MMKLVAGCSALVTGAVAIGACYGGVDASKEPEVAVADRAALVQKKRKWLEGFDRHCDACFAAFDLCEQGAQDDERDACRTAMDACVRGGLRGNDAGVADAGDPLTSDASLEDDGGEPFPDDDAGIDEPLPEDDAGFDSDAGIDGPEDAAVDPADAGNEGDPDDLDAGIGEEDAGDEVDFDAGLEPDAEVPDGPDRARDVLVAEIGTCLDLARGCLQPDGADFAQCVSGLQACVEQAVEEAFEVICSEQVRACRAEQRSRESVERVERECRANLLI